MCYCFNPPGDPDSPLQCVYTCMCIYIYSQMAEIKKVPYTEGIINNPSEILLVTVV